MIPSDKIPGVSQENLPAISRGALMSIQDLLQTGVEAYQSGDLTLARSILSRAVMEDPNSVSAWVWLGRSLADVEQKRYCFRRAVMLDKSNPEARQELEKIRRAEAPASQAAPSPASAPPIPTAVPYSSNQKPAAKRARLADRAGLLWGVLAVLLVGMVTGVAAIIWLVVGGLNHVKAAQLAVRPTPTPTPTATFILSTFPPTWTLTSLPTRRPMATGTPTPTTNPTEAAMRSTLIAAPSLAPTFSAMARHDKYLADVRVCQQTMAGYTDDPIAYYQRAACYWNIGSNLSVGDDYFDYVHRGLKEIDQAISIYPQDASYFVLRARFYIELNKEFPNRVDSDQIYQVALENYRIATQLNPNDIKNPLNSEMILVNLGRCAEALEIGNQLLKQVPDITQTSGDFDKEMAAGLACEGQYDQAMVYVDLGINSGNACNCMWEKGYYQYLTGHVADAETTLMNYPAANDDRYFLIGLIDIEQGRVEDARIDLQVGEQNTWNRHGLHAYLAGKLALIDGDRQTAIKDFQDAEATLPHRQSQLLPKIRNDLAQLGSGPLAPGVSFGIKTTPIPTITGMPPLPTRTPTPE
jgi:tetratricopeptide (TPR) repeat protein